MFPNQNRRGSWIGHAAVGSSSSGLPVLFILVGCTKGEEEAGVNFVSHCVALKEHLHFPALVSQLPTLHPGFPFGAPALFQFRVVPRFGPGAGSMKVTSKFKLQGKLSEPGEAESEQWIF